MRGTFPSTLPLSAPTRQSPLREKPRGSQTGLNGCRFYVNSSLFSCSESYVFNKVSENNTVEQRNVSLLFRRDPHRRVLSSLFLSRRRNIKKREGERENLLCLHLSSVLLAPSREFISCTLRGGSRARRDYFKRASGLSVISIVTLLFGENKNIGFRSDRKHRECFFLRNTNK